MNQEPADREFRILILEDNPDDADLISHALRNAKIAFVARRVDDQESFLNELRQFVPDVILADYTLPSFTAIDALHLMEKHQHSIPFILVTGSQSEEVAVECLKRGAGDYILKQSLTRLPTAMLNVLSQKAAETEREKAQQALRQSEEQYRLIAENTKDLICVLDVQGNLQYVSPSARQVLGKDPREFVGKDFFSLVHPQDHQTVLTTIRQALFRKEEVSVEFRSRHSNEEWRMLEAIGGWIFDEKQNPQKAVVISRDITDRKRAEKQLKRTSEELRTLSAHLQTVREEERRRIAREIHDELGQAMTALKMDLAWLELKIADRHKIDVIALLQKINSMSDLIDSTIQTIRKIATELRPMVLDDIGLSAAIEWQTIEFHQRTGIRCTFTTAVDEPKLNREQSTALFRILQEALTNVVRHAKARNVSIQLDATQSEITLVIQDDGKGINLSELAGRDSLGLLGMRERAYLLGGSLEIDRTETRGTKVSVRIPLAGVPGKKEDSEYLTFPTHD